MQNHVARTPGDALAPHHRSSVTRTHGPWSRKALAVAVAEGTKDSAGLRRSLGPWGLVALGVGGVVGAGIFVVTGTVAAEYAGPAVAVSFVIAACACLLAGLCYAELAAMIPAAGSAYTYTYVALGELAAFIVGWNLILEYLVACGLVASGWSGYFAGLLRESGLSLPQAWSVAPLEVGATGVFWTGAVLNLPAMLVVGVIAGVLCLGIRHSAVFGAAAVVLKLVIIVLFIAAGLLYVDPHNWVPFVPPNTGSFGAFGWSGVLRAAAVVFVAYLGFDAVSTAAQETTNPQRALPFGILGTLLIATVLYVLVCIVMTGLAPYRTLSVPNPVQVALSMAGPGLAWLRPLVGVATVVGLASVILLMLLGQSRIFFAMSRDGLLPRSLAEIHQRRGTPVKATLIVAGLAAVIAGVFPVRLLGEIISLGTLTAFGTVCISVLVLRVVQPEAVRPFRVPWVPVIPILGAAWCVTMMLSLPRATWFVFALWLAVGTVLYFAYGRRQARLR